MAYQNKKVKARQVVTTTTQTKELGTVANVPMGEWNSATQYRKLNMVRSHNATYQAKKDNRGVEPTVTTGWQEFWQVVAYDGRGVVSSTISYQTGISNTIVPAGEWSENLPDVPQGQYLWTRTIYNFTDGTQNISYSVSLQGLNFTQQDRADINRITDAIPSSASESNPLATENFVNSSINSFAAFYITYTAIGDKAFPTRADLLNATTFYSGGKERVPTQNDYAIVQADESQPRGADESYPTTRYSYQGGTYPNGQWDFQYVVNNTSLTQAQIDAINSGITTPLVTKLNGIESGAQRNPTNYVTTDTNQSIDGYKTFAKPIRIKPSGVVSGDYESGIIRCTLPSGDTDYTGIIKIDVDGSPSSNTGIRYEKNSKKAMLLCNEHYLEIPNKDSTLATLEDLQELVICSSGATITAKTVDKDGFELKVGSRITINFTYGNSVVSPTLNVNSTGAKTIKADGDTSYVKWLSGTVMEFIYDGTHWVVLNGYQLAGMRVGHVYIATGSTSPATLFGGTWSQIAAGYALWTATSGAGSTIAAGLPNITGELSNSTIQFLTDTWSTQTGALSLKSGSTSRYISSASNTATRSTGFSFNASNSNTIYGNSSTVQPPAYKVYAWRRTA